ncbi:GNAT family N-acetyltransferase [Clostridium lacusfryxellense]|nr:GNAT family N-acetyltransferase [Clostridium lacusfryxellense]
MGWCCTGPCDELPEPNREVGYAISKYYRNKGYTTQAVQGLIKYMFEKTNIKVLNAIVLSHNVSSNRVIQKCGFRYMNNIEIENREFYYYKLRRRITYSIYFLVVSITLAKQYNQQLLYGNVIWSIIVLMYTFKKRKYFMNRYNKKG